MRILIIAHGHPELNPGGGEIAALNEHRYFLAHGIESCFLGRTDRAEVSNGGTPFISIDDSRQEFLFLSKDFDIFYLSQLGLTIFTTHLAEFLRAYDPDIVHVHHYFHLGLEIFPLIRRVLPNAKVVLTLHEYYAICAQRGLLLTSNRQPCLGNGTVKCSVCLPSFTPSEFAFRDGFVRDAFNHIDLFIAPSEFLRQQYFSWGGIPSLAKLIVVENLIEFEEPPHSGASVDALRPFTFAFFGQINDVKGVDLLLDAAHLLRTRLKGRSQSGVMTEGSLKQKAAPFELELHGSGLEHQTAEFQASIKTKIALLKTCRVMGRYHSREVIQKMKAVDCIVVPSVWYENSPVVIQEAKYAGVPLIVANIGGMAEKVTSGRDGLHFAAGSANDLASAMHRMLSDEGLRSFIKSNIEPPAKPEIIFKALLAEFAQLLEKPKPRRRSSKPERRFTVFRSDNKAKVRLHNARDSELTKTAD